MTTRGEEREEEEERYSRREINELFTMRIIVSRSLAGKSTSLCRTLIREEVPAIAIRTRDVYPRDIIVIGI